MTRALVFPPDQPYRSGVAETVGDRVRAICMSLPEVTEKRSFRPPYVGSRGWLGVRLDGCVDCDELTAVCTDAYRRVAPAKLVATLDTAEA